MEGGFIKISRKDFEEMISQGRRQPGGVMKPLAECDVLHYLPRYGSEPGTITANGQDVILQQGELACSIRYLAQRWMWSEGRVHGFINKLIKSGELVRARKGKPGFHGTPDVYRITPQAEGTKKPERKIERISKGISVSKSGSNGGSVNECLNERLNEEEESNKRIYPDDFLNFWEEYHKRTQRKPEDKYPAFKHWQKLSDKEKQQAVAKAPAYASTITDPRYVKKARTYLSDKIYADDIPAQNPVNNDFSKYRDLN